MARFMMGLSWTAAAVAVLVLVLRVSDLGVTNSTGLAAGIVAIGVSMSVLMAWRTTPSRGTLVRRADSRFGTKTQLSTALEWVEAPTPTAAQRVLRDALVRDAERITSRVDARVLAPFRFKLPHGIAAAVTVVAVVGVGIVGSMPTNRSETLADTPVRPAMEFDEVQRDAFAEELERLADALQAGAEYEEDEYLQALTKSSRDLAEEVRSGAAGAEAAGERLDHLLTHVGEALGPRFVPVTQRADVAEELARLPTPDRESGADGSASPSSASSNLDDMASRVQSLREQVEDLQSRRADNPYGAVFRPDDVAGATSVEDERAGAVMEGDAAGAPTGTARRSTDAPGDAAGAGTTDLTSGQQHEVEAFTDQEDVRLPSATTDPGGARVRAAGEPTEGEASEVAGAGASLRSGGDIEDGQPTSLGADSDVRTEQGGWRDTTLTPGVRQLASRLLAPVSLQ